MVSGGMMRAGWIRIRHDTQVASLVATFLTTLAVFAIYLVQGILIARLLGPQGRGEFGTCMCFPRDLLLFAGLLGAIEVFTGYAARRANDPIRLKYSAARLGLLTGCLTALVSALLVVVLLVATSRQYLIPYALFCCLFVPIEHIHLTISSVDRGNEAFARYNINRLVFALAFPLLAGLAWSVDLASLTGVGWLWLMCLIWVGSRFVGVLPTLRGMDLLDWRRARRLDSGLPPAEIPGTRQLLREGRPFALSTLVSELFERLDIFLVLALATLVEAGHYLVAIPAASMLIVAPNALGVFTFNAGAKDGAPVARTIAFRILILTAAFQIVSATLYALVVDDLILFFFSDQFAESIPMVMLLLPVMAIKGFLQAADGYLKGRGKPLIGVRARFLSILVMLGFVMMAWPSWGLPAIPLGACVGQAFSMVVIVAAIWFNTGRAAETGEVD